MPKDTFYNLPDVKRSLVLECSYREFANRDYRSASLTRIVEEAGIAKGSVYQYFENKLDLYRHLIDVAVGRKLDFLRRVETEGSFFERFRAIVFRSLEFNLANPLLSHILYLAAREAPTSEIADITDGIHRDSHAFIREMLERATDDVQDGLDTDLAAYLLSEMSIRLEDYLEQRFDFSYSAVLAEGLPSLPIPQSELERVADSFIDIIRSGLGGSPGGQKIA